MRKLICRFVTGLTVATLLCWDSSLLAQGRDSYGVELLTDSNFQVPPQLFSAMSQGGIRWGKVGFDRELVHIGPNQYDWSAMDAIVNQAATHGFQLLGSLGGTLLWDTAEPKRVDYFTYPPRVYEYWADSVFQTVSRYKNQVRYWEIGNEPDIPPPAGFWNGTPAEYARFLAVAYGEVKRADPTAQVLIGGFLAISGSEDFFQAIMADPDNPADQNFDIMNIHAYWSRADAREKVILWRSMTEKPLWVTEMGWPSYPALQQQIDPAFCCGEAAQAQFLQTVLPELVSLGAEKVFWFALWVHENPWGGYDTYALLDRVTFAPKPAYFALRDLLVSLPP